MRGLVILEGLSILCGRLALQLPTIDMVQDLSTRLQIELDAVQLLEECKGDRRLLITAQERIRSIVTSQMGFVKHQRLDKVGQGVFVEGTAQEGSATTNVSVDLAELCDGGDKVSTIWDRLADVLEKVPVGVLLEDSHLQQTVHQDGLDCSAQFDDKKIVASEGVQDAVRDRHADDFVQLGDDEIVAGDQ